MGISSFDISVIRRGEQRTIHSVTTSTLVENLSDCKEVGKDNFSLDCANGQVDCYFIDQSSVNGLAMCLQQQRVVCLDSAKTNSIESELGFHAERSLNKVAKVD